VNSWAGWRDCSKLDVILGLDPRMTEERLETFVGDPKLPKTQPH